MPASDSSVPTSGETPKVGSLVAFIGRIHEHLIFNRRVKVLIERIGRLIPAQSTMLDVGTGDGQIAQQIAKQSEGSSVSGIDIMLRPETHIPVELFDGTTIPNNDNSVDVVSFVDVLHHTDDPSVLIKEAARVAKGAVVIKDHLSENGFDHVTLRLMDWVGNAPHGVVLPYNYASKDQWMKWFDDADLEVETFETDLPLYGFPLSVVFGRKLHFVARLVPKS